MEFTRFNLICQTLYNDYWVLNFSIKETYRHIQIYVSI